MDAADTLSDVLEVVRLTGALFFLVDAHTPWVAEAPASTELLPAILPRAEHIVSYRVTVTGSLRALPVKWPAEEGIRLFMRKAAEEAERTDARPE